MSDSSLKIERSMANKLVCVTVGLPARGKTFIAQKIKRYLRWLGIRTRVFNVGDYRRRLCGNYGNSGTGTPNMLNHEFFDATNVEASLLRHESALLALNDMIEWLTSESDESQVISLFFFFIFILVIYEPHNWFKQYYITRM